jgi:hypothetical protein
MEIRNGFIVGIFNYCDRWCDACAFTSRCRLFADSAEIEASLDPGLKALVEAPALQRETSPPPPPWLEELLREMDEALLEPADGAESPEPSLPSEHLAIEQRAHDYGMRAYAWLQQRKSLSNDPADPQAVIERFHILIGVKTHRAVHGLADDQPEERDWPPDHDGSAKVALLGIDRSHVAWLELIERRVVTDAEAAPFIADLVWLGEALDRVFPDARAFVRPALDEPEEVSKLLAREHS